MIFDFLKYCLGRKDNMSNVVADIDWEQLYSFASKQAILGFCFDGIKRLGKEYPEGVKQNPIGRELLMTWMGKAQQIRRQNMKVNLVASKFYSMFREDGLRCCILDCRSGSSGMRICNAQMWLACQMVLEKLLYQRRHSMWFIS